MPTLRQERLAEALENPEIRTKEAAMIVAGYAKSTARRNMGRQSALVGTVRAREEVKARQSDKARGILSKSTAVVSRELDSGHDPDYALKAMVAAAAVIEKVPEQDDSDDAQHVETVKAKIARAFSLGVRWGRSHPQGLVLSQQAGDIITVEDAKSAE